MPRIFRSPAAPCFLCCAALALSALLALLAPAAPAHAADMDSITDKIGSIFHKGKDKAADLLEKGGQVGRELRDDALRKGDELLDSIDKSLDGKQSKPAPPVYSRLIVRNLCDKAVTAHIAEQRDNAGYNASQVDARAQQHIEVWQGTKTPPYTYTFRQAGDTAPQKALPLADILKKSEKTLVQHGDTTFHDYTYTLCRDREPLGTSPNHAPSPAAPVKL